MRRCAFCFRENSTAAVVCRNCGSALSSTRALLYARLDADKYDWSVFDRAFFESHVEHEPLLRTPGNPVIELLLGKPADLDAFVRKISFELPNPHTILFLDLFETPFDGIEPTPHVTVPRKFGDRVTQHGTFMNRGAENLRGIKEFEIAEEIVVPFKSKKVILRSAQRDLLLPAPIAWAEIRELRDVAARESHHHRLIKVSRPVPDRRFLEAMFPHRVRLGSTASLEVRIAIRPSSPDAAPLDPLRIPVEGLTVKLSVHGTQGFRIPRSVHEVVVTPNVDSKWVQFDVEALQPGAHRLEIIAYVDGVQAGALSIESAIEELALTGEPQTTSQNMDLQRRPPGDATLDITYDSKTKTYRYKWFSADQWLPSEEITLSLEADPRTRLERLLSTINGIASERSGLSRTAAEKLLRGVAIELWREIIPKPLEEVFYRYRVQTKRLMLRIRNDALPWELLYPPDIDAGFLAEQFILSRWSSARELRSTIEMKRGDAVIPPKSPPRAADEVLKIKEILKPGTTLDDPVDNIDVLLRLLEKADFQLLHFACHHSYSSGSGINFDGSYFRPAFLEDNHFSAPLVFINACRADNKESTFTGVESWAEKFIDCGAAAFVGTLWDVRDEPASEFATTFYRLIAAGHSLGDAVLQARAQIRDPSDPTWLAYVLYADPGAVIRR